MASDFNRKDLEQAFRTDPKYGIECLDAFFQEEVAGYIKFVGYGALDTHDMADIYQNVIVDLIQAVQKPNFDPTEPMRLVYRIAYTNTKDYLKKRRIRSAANLDDCLNYLTDDFKGTDVELRWKYMTKEQQTKFNNALFEIINELSEMQRITAIVFITRFKEIRDTNLFTAVAEGIREFANIDITVAAAKGNWYRARTKIAEELLIRGFDVISLE
ncbi:MAG: sigma-70 family RNA polymerase sigma factor [Candidatus Brocadiales bacterium]|nr:sigma-70 family RNA polymerase sigma factor [Candidatus Bathyanammoxibius sp.]